MLAEYEAKPMTLNLNFLETFVKIAESGSFSKAAVNLNLTQSAISQQIEVLENFFGAKLFERSIKGVTLTEEGKVLLKRTRIILDNLKLAKIEISNSLGEVKGILRISSSTVPGEYILPKYFIKFKAKAPNVEFQIEVNDSEISLTKLADGDVDLAAIGTLITDGAFESMVLEEEELILAVPKNHELARQGLHDLKEILKYPYILREKTSGTRKETEKILKKAGISLEDMQIIGELNTTESILTAISEGLGISIISSIAASKLEKTDLIKCLQLPPDFAAKRKLYLVKKKGQDKKVIQEFWDFILESRR
ncbi:MAG TPA: selenium metabolism-associated LysR family transcriptional regulator [Candidatus Deferrimicrobium sp.]|nr:selenium metabolism-associated LysR family transcriptional regulator [Candidatus Deferrimicrobium sp.]